MIKSMEIESHGFSGRGGGGRGGEAAQAYLEGIATPLYLVGTLDKCTHMSRRPIPC